MNYKIVIEKVAQKFIRKQNPKQQEKLIKAIKALPEGNDISRLKGYENYYRLRIGSYRIIYIKQDDVYIIKVINVDNRGDVYKKM